MILRGVNNQVHSRVAMAELCTIDPDRIRVIDCDHEDIWIRTAAGVEETAPDSIRRRRAGAVESGLSNGMTAWIEFENDGIAYGRLDSVWIIGNFAVVARYDDVLRRERGSGKKEGEEVQVVHFDINKGIAVVEYKIHSMNKRTGLQISGRSQSWERDSGF